MIIQIKPGMYKSNNNSIDVTVIDNALFSDFLTHIKQAPVTKSRKYMLASTPDLAILRNHAEVAKAKVPNNATRPAYKLLVIR